MKTLLFAGIAIALCTCVFGGGDYGRRDWHDRDGYKKKDPCELPKEEGSCHDYHRRFHFSDKDKMCKEFTFRGCKKNENHFASRKACYDKCGKRCGRKGDDETLVHDFTIKMSNPIEFYRKHAVEYQNKCKVAIASIVPVSTTEIKIYSVTEGSTVMKLEVKRSFDNEDKYKMLVQMVEEGKFSFTVAGITVSSVKGQKVAKRVYEGEKMYKKRCRKIFMIVGAIVVIIGVLIAIIVVVKCMQKKKMRAAPMETAKKAFESVWKGNNHNVESETKADLPPSYESAYRQPYPAPPVPPPPPEEEKKVPLEDTVA